MAKQALTLIGFLVTVVLAFHLYAVVNSDQRWRIGFIDALERQAYDFRVRFSASDNLNDTVVIIDIDDRSLQKHGQWPWSRAVFAQLNDQLFENYLIEGLGYDITFPEPEQRYSDDAVAALLPASNSAEDLLSRLREKSGDEVFARSMEGRNVILGCVFETLREEHAINVNAGVLPQPVFLNSPVDYDTLLQETNAPLMGRYVANIPTLTESAAGVGFFNIADQVGDADGIVRRVELLNKYDGRLYASLTLQLVQQFFLDEVQPHLTEQSDDGNSGLEGLDLLLGRVPVDQQAAVYVPYGQPRKSFQYIPATDILTGEYQGDLTGALALVGTSAPGLVDLRNTPFEGTMPGVEVHANVLAAMTEENGFRVKPGWVATSDLLIVSVLGVLLSFLFPRLSALAATLVFLVTSSVLIGVNWHYWTKLNVILTIAPALLVVGSLYFLNMIVGFFAETKARRSTQKMFGMYVPPEVVSEISETKDIFSMRPEKKNMTVLFTDIRNFTTISEGMPPDELSDWMNEFLTPMTQIIHKHGGAIDKYMGDCIMAFWGAPIDDAEHAAHGITAALDILQELDVLNARFQRKRWPEIRIGIGLNTGLMSVGNMGSEFRMAYTVLGDAVNLGARLESITKEYGVDLIVSEFTRAAAPEFHYTELDTVKVKGKNEAVTIYGVEALSKH